MRGATLQIRRADNRGFGRAWTWPIQAAVGALFFFSLLLSLLFLPIATYTFWVLFTIIAYLFGISGSPGWPLQAALATGILAASGVAYLIQDRILLLGNDRARRVLLEKARQLLGGALPSERYFVQIRSLPRQTRSAAPDVDDIGWIVLYPERLEFVGDTLQVAVPTGLVRGVERGPDLSSFGLGGSWVDLTLRAPNGPRSKRLRLQSRDADRLSATGEGARTLATALSGWLRAAPAHPDENV